MRWIAGTTLLLVAGLALAHDAAAPASKNQHTADLIFRRDGPGGGRSISVCSPTRTLLKDLKALDPNQLAQPGDHISGCGAPASAPPPQLAPFGDATYYVLASALPYRIEEAGDVITIPAGFVTDLASIPPLFWPVGFPRDGQYMSAAILHDYLYWDQRCKREQADVIFLEQMDRFGVGARKAGLVYDAVRRFGQSAWDQNAANKKRQIRVIPNPYLANFLSGTLDASQSWERVEQTMKAKGLKPAADTGNPNIASICVKAFAADSRTSD